MSDYFPENPSPEINNSPRTYEELALAAVAPRPYYGHNPTAASPVQQEPSFANTNNQSPLIWNISLTDDQDEISEKFLKMRDEPKILETFVPTSFTEPENLRKQADELFKSSEMNPSEVSDLMNSNISRILPSNCQQYLKPISQNGPAKKEKLVLNSWSEKNAWHYPWSNRGVSVESSANNSVSSPTYSDQSFMSLSSSTSVTPLRPPHGHWSSSPNNNSNNANSPLPGLDRSGSVTTTTASDSATMDPSAVSGCSDRSCCANAVGREWSPCARRAAAFSIFDWSLPPLAYSGRTHVGQPTTLWQHHAPSLVCKTNTTAASGGQRFPKSDHDDDDDDSVSSPPQPPPPPSTAAVRWPSRMFYCVNADSNTVSKLVEHYCTFCYKNHEPPEVYGSHLVRDAVRTTCPKLRALRCKHCNGTGDSAHTIKYCPFLYANYCS